MMKDLEEFFSELTLKDPYGHGERNLPTFHHNGRKLFTDKAQQVDIEERHDRVEKSKYNQSKIRVETHVPGKKIKINLTSLAKSLPTLKRGEPINLANRGTYVYTGFDELRNDCIILNLSDMSWEIYQRCGADSVPYDLSLGHNSSIYSNKIKACKEVSENAFWLDSLLPGDDLDQKVEAKLDPILEVHHLTSEGIVCRNKSLNDGQRGAIVNILKAHNRPQPYLLFGPPGTGKTTTLAEIVIQIYQRSSVSSVLVCANSNICVDGLAQKIVNYNLIKPHHIVRLIASSREGLEDATPSEVVRITVTDFKLRNSEIRPRIILTTCQKSASLQPNDYDSGYEFDFVIVDEVGHSQEPETLIPYLLCKKDGSVIFGGDPHQLQPVCKSKDAPLLRESTLRRLFECNLYKKKQVGGVMKYDERYITKLLGCHRSDKRVMRVSNKLFYDNELEFTHETPERLLDIFMTKDPLLFCPSLGRESKLINDTSYLNREEAIHCINFVKLVYNKGYKPHDIGIIAAYKSQVTHISSKFDDYNIEPCKVASIDEFQGEEKQIIIISTVRSSGNSCYVRPGALGFLREYERFNVAISRARDIVIVVGNPNILKRDKNWSEYIRNAQLVSLDLRS